MNTTTANTINPFSISRFFFINTSRTSFETLADTFTGKDYFLDIIPAAGGLEPDDNIVYGNRAESEIYSVKKLIKAKPIDPDSLEIIKQQIPRSKNRDDRFEKYNFMIRPSKGFFILLVMNNIEDCSLQTLFFTRMKEANMGFDAELFTNTIRPTYNAQRD